MDASCVFRFQETGAGILGTSALLGHPKSGVYSSNSWNFSYIVP